MTQQVPNTTTTTLALRTKDGIKFGKELREKEFLFNKGYLNLNHGSFGTYPRAVRSQMRSFQDEVEGAPDHFIRYHFPLLLDSSREAVGKLLNVPSSTVVFVSNATTGVNVVLRNLTFESGDYILYCDTIYGACEKTVTYITETTPAKSIKVEYTLPVEDDWLVDELKKKVKEVEQSGGRVKVAIFDTVVSMPGVRMPFERLTAACKELGVLSCVDGAHGIGHVELDLSKLNPDFFVSNCHKWLHVPRGCAVFHVPIRNQHLIRSTLPTSHGFQPKEGKIATPLPKSASGKSAWVANFDFTGTVDNAPYLCVPAAVQWRENIGGETKIREYCTTLAQGGAKLVAKELGTEVLDNSTNTLTQCCLANVRLPISMTKVQEISLPAGTEESEVGASVRDWMSKTLIDDYGTFMAILFYNGAWWVRFSGQVYLELADFEWAAKTLKKISERVEAGEWVAVKGKP